MNIITEIEYDPIEACQEGHDIPIAIERVAESDIVHPDRLEHSLQMLEALQSTFRRGRRALAPYFDDACAAYERLESMEGCEGVGDEERQRILETCEALEKLLRMSEKSRGCLESQTRFSLS